MNDNPPEIHSRVWLGWLLLAVLLAGYGAFLANRFSPAINTPDANGYWAQGTLLARTGSLGARPASPLQFVSSHWVLTPGGVWYSLYPPGLAVPVAALTRFINAEASLWLNPFLAMLALLGAYLLTRQLTGPFFALLAPLLLALNPSFNHHALACDSHMAITALLVWGVYLLLAWSRRGGLWRALLAGLLLGSIPTIRYPEVLFGLGVAVFLLWNARRRANGWRDAGAAAAGALLPVILLVIYNRLAFGAIGRTAYYLTNEQGGFGWRYFSHNVVPYLQDIPGWGIGLFFALGLVGMLVMCGDRERRPLGVLLLLLVVPITLLYMSYYWSSLVMGLATMRFLLPTFVLYILAGIYLLNELGKRMSRLMLAGMMALLLLAQGAWGLPTSMLESRLQKYSKVFLARITQALNRQAGEGDLIFSSPKILQHLDFIRRWKLVDLSVLSLDRAWGSDAEPRAASRVSVQKEFRERQLRKYLELAPAERTAAVVHDAVAWAGNHKIFYVGPASWLDRMSGPEFGARAWVIVARVKLPKPPPLLRDDSGPPRAVTVAADPWSFSEEDKPGKGDAASRKQLQRWFDRQRIMVGGANLGLLQDLEEMVIAEWRTGSPSADMGAASAPPEGEGD